MKCDKNITFFTSVYCMLGCTTTASTAVDDNEEYIENNADFFSYILVLLGDISFYSIAMSV